MDGRRIMLTPWTTLHFSSLGFVYTGPAESVAGPTFARPPRPNVLTGAARREAFVRGFSDDVIIGMLGPNPMQERYRLVEVPPDSDVHSGPTRNLVHHSVRRVLLPDDALWDKKCGCHLPTMHATRLRGVDRPHHRSVRRRHRSQVKKDAGLSP
jgi:hypothetical protein